jgi:hypothetical protein
MGRTNPTFRDHIRHIEGEYQAFRRALRRQDQELFDQLFGYARAHADAASYMNHSQPEVMLLFSICLRQQRELEALRQELQEDADDPVEADAVQD